jgi:pentatricopeptide repeat protein
MLEEGIIPTAAMYHHIFKHFSAAHRLQDLQYYWTEMRRHGVTPDSTLCNIVIQAFSKHAHADPAFDIYREMRAAGVKPSEHTYHSLVAACARTADFQTATKTVAEMLNEGFELTPYILMSLIGTCTEKSQLERCTDLFAHIGPKSTLSDKIKLYNKFMRKCIELGDLETGLTWYKQLRSLGRNFDSSSYVAVIQGCCSPTARQYDMAMRLFADMQEDRVPLTQEVYDALLVQARDPDRIGYALDVLKIMLANRFLPSAVTWNRLLEACCHADRMEDAQYVWNTMQRHHYLPKTSTCRVFLDALKRADLTNQVEEVKSRLLQVKHNKQKGEKEARRNISK